MATTDVSVFSDDHGNMMYDQHLSGHRHLHGKCNSNSSAAGPTPHRSMLASKMNAMRNHEQMLERVSESSTTDEDVEEKREDDEENHPSLSHKKRKQSNDDDDGEATYQVHSRTRSSSRFATHFQTNSINNSDGQPIMRLSLSTSLDPITLLPTTKSRAMVIDLRARVFAQLQRDYAASYLAPVHRQALCEESMAYLHVLDAWLNQDKEEFLTTQPAERGDMVVVASPRLLPQTYQGLFTDHQVCYVKVKHIRDSIYGSVELYQLGTRRSPEDLVQLIQPAEFVAIKCYDKAQVQRRRSRTGHKVQEDPIRELVIHQHLNCPGHRGVIPLLAVLETDWSLFAVYPFIGPDMFDYVSTCKMVQEPQAKLLFRKMVESVDYCHLMGVCHRDISLENFLLRSQQLPGHPKPRSVIEPVLIDFGLSVIYWDDDQEDDGESDELPPGIIPHSGAIGKEYYMAPEVFAKTGIPYDALKADVWGLGICLALMLVGFPLWVTPCSADERFRVIVLQGRLGELLNDWGVHLSASAISLLERMLAFDPQERASIDEALAHEWFQQIAITM